MIFELVGSRVLGPYFGTSIYVWTSLIGIILASLSVGYALGGKAADAHPTRERLAWIVFCAAACIALMLLLKEHLLFFLEKNVEDIRFGSVIASFLLFSPASVLLGMVSPYAVRLKLVDIEHAGSMVGNLSALSTAGSIFGTFISGFVLIPWLGTNRILWVLVLILLGIAFMLFREALQRYAKSKGIFALFALIAVLPLRSLSYNGIDVDTPYQRVWIYDDTSKGQGQAVRVLRINRENHSSMFLEKQELVNEYTKYYHLARHFVPSFRKTLMIGGGAYSFPKDFLAQYASGSMDVVEIDPTLTELARTHFRLRDDPRLTIYHEDGRVFLNRTHKKYDVIFGDAFGSYYSIPYQLTTKEAVQKTFDALEENGAVILNMITAIEGDGGMFLRAEYATYKAVFPQVYLFPVQSSDDGTRVQNIMLVALKNPASPSFTSSDPILEPFLRHRWTKEVANDVPLLTDDFAPVDQYVGKGIF